MILIKFALLTSAFYLGLTVLLLLSFFGGAYLLKASPGIYWTRWGLVVPFGVVWFVSFVAAYHFTMLKLKP